MGLASLAQQNADLGPARHFRRVARRAVSRRSTCRRPIHGLPPTGCTANSRWSASISRRIRSTSTRRRCRRCGCRTGREFSAAVKRGAAAGRLAGTVTTKQERKTRTGNKMGVIAFSDTSGQYEAVLFSEGLAQYRDLLEPGRSVVITVSAEDRPEGVNLRIQTVQSLEDEASRIQKALRIFVRDAAPHRHAGRPACGEGRRPGQLRADQGSRRRARSRSNCPTATASRRRSPRRCARCRVWSKWNWCRLR